MRLRPSQLAVSSVLLFFLESAAASSISSSNMRISGREGKPDNSSILKASIERMRLGLANKNKEILRLLGEENFEPSEPSMRRHIEALHERFFDVLARSRFCPPLSSEAKARMLGMSPESFRKKCNRWYNDYVWAFRQSRIGICSLKKEALRSKIASEERQCSAHPRKLQALKASLRRCESDYDRNIAKLKMHQDCHRKIESMSCKVLGESSVSALYASYLVGQRSLLKKEREYAELNRRYPPSREKVGCECCMVCTDLLKPNGENVHCVQDHGFHTKCLYEWKVRWNGICPLCRGPFSEEQQSRLTEYEARRKDHLRDLHGDPGFEKRYVSRGREEDDLLESACEVIRKRIWVLKGHPSYPAVFNSPESSVYRRFYIPQNIASYFENTEVGHHDPRSRGFTRHRAVLIKYMLDYRKQLHASPYLELTDGIVVLDYDIVLPVHSMLSIFFVVDALLEYLYTRLHEIKDLAKKRSAIASSPATYPALHSLVSQYPDHSLDQIYCKLRLMAKGFGLSVPVYSRQWLLMVSGVFSEILAEA